ncbi:HNH endonuclease [Nocardiopsis mwathae]|uniref:HNH endonuclease n=1 Tax=Nocardiopsis mwathae TaxID=1472723 RepID=UPI0037429C69
MRAVAEDDIQPGAEHALGEDLIGVLRALDEVKLACADVAALFQACGGLVGSGQSSLSHWLQHTADRSPSEAAQLASLAHRPVHLEESERAYASGEIPLARFERICHWVNEGLACRSQAEWPDTQAFALKAQESLLELAVDPSATVAAVNRTGRRLRYMSNPALHEKEYQDRYAGRGAVLSRGVNGSFHLEAWGDEASGDALRGALDAFLAPPGEREERTAAQRMHDALVDVCSTVVALPAEAAPLRRAGAAPVSVVVGLDTLQGKEGAAPAVSEYGTLWPASAARAHTNDCQLTRVVSDPLDGRPLDVGRSRRLFSPEVRTALMAQRQTCAWEGGCDRPIAWCQVDHRLAWWDGGASDLDNAQPLCRYHNLEKEHRRARERGWEQRPRPRRGGKRPDPFPNPKSRPLSGSAPPGIPRHQRPEHGQQLTAEDTGTDGDPLSP